MIEYERQDVILDLEEKLYEAKKRLYDVLDMLEEWAPQLRSEESRIYLTEILAVGGRKKG